MVFIYILKLQQGKYYVGKTTNPSFRIDSHFNANGSAWTKKYAPIKLLELLPDKDDYDEDKYTKIYMDKYGVDNVRGGSYASVKLDDATISHLSQMSNGTNDKCFTCGKSGHFARDCNKKVEEVVIWCCPHCDKEFESKRKALEHERKCKNQVIYESDNEDDDDDESDEDEEESDDEFQSCYRCGREGHYANTCYASKHIKGYYLK
jgi:cellular nucleic acid-binding protein